MDNALRFFGLEDIDFQRIAVNVEEIEEFHLPPMPKSKEIIEMVNHDTLKAAAKNTIQNMVSVQKMSASNVNYPIITPQYADEFVKRSNEITENIVRALRINNQLKVNAIDAAAENFRTFNRTIDSVTEFNTSAAKAWNSFLTTQQQQFLHRQ